jgi:hypothetical protein
MTRTRAHDTERTRRATDETPAVDTPKKGETYRCGGCGMELEVIADCRCEDPEHVRLECCGRALTRV